MKIFKIILQTFLALLAIPFAVVGAISIGVGTLLISLGGAEENEDIH